MKDFGQFRRLYFTRVNEKNGSTYPALTYCFVRNGLGWTGISSKNSTMG